MLLTACERFMSNNDWEVVERAKEKGFNTAKLYAEDLIAIFFKNPGRENTAMEINEKLVQPLIE